MQDLLGDSQQPDLILYGSLNNTAAHFILFSFT